MYSAINLAAVTEPATHAQRSSSRRIAARSAYFDLLAHDDRAVLDAATAASSLSFLNDRLSAAALLPSDLPDDPADLPAWSKKSGSEAAAAYGRYLAERKSGAPRRYFESKSHALYLLKAVAPTKLVDGSWLWGLTQHADDHRMAPLIRTYLEELGEGDAAQNHVVIYRQLLEAHGLESWDTLEDDHFTQGAIQLALGHHAADFLPEIVGFNLGYEQLPLHLLITAYELVELGIDPYYFTVHVTVDNAATGHARKAVQAVADLMPRSVQRTAFWRRVVNGYKLNLLGMGTNDAIGSFDAERELVAVLAHKGEVGAGLHSDRCRIGGKTVNEWLAGGDAAGFLAALQHAGWIKRHQDPEDSRFWHLLQGDRAPMFGVFNRYEMQLLHDWIAGSQRHTAGAARPRMALGPAGRRVAPPPAAVVFGPGTVSELAAQHLASAAESGGDIDADLRRLQSQLAAVNSRAEALQRLSGWLSPALHHTPAGLAATRLYAALFNR